MKRMQNPPPPPAPYTDWLGLVIASAYSPLASNCAAAELAELRAERDRLRELVNDAAGRVGRAWELTPFWRDWLEAARLELAK